MTDPRDRARGAWSDWTDEDRATERDSYKEMAMAERSLREWANEFHAVSKSKGFWDDFPTLKERIASIPMKLCLIHSEVSEALEDFRTGADPTAKSYEGKKLCGFGSEIADVIIRSMELAEALGIDIQAIIEEKNEYNKTRSFRNGGKLI